MAGWRGSARSTSSSMVSTNRRRGPAAAAGEPRLRLAERLDRNDREMLSPCSRSAPGLASSRTLTRFSACRSRRHASAKAVLSSRLRIKVLVTSVGRPAISASAACILAIEHEPVDQARIMTGDRRGIGLQAELVHDLRGRPLHGLAGDDRRHGDHRRRAGPKRRDDAGYGQDRIDAEIGVGRADDDAGEVRASRSAARTCGEARAASRAPKRMARTRGPALLAHEIVLEGQRAPVRSSTSVRTGASLIGRIGG